ncbi:hypothetical protein [Allokutzneria albata]|nr:hypothetical protein [Allokutzneria albata]
MKGVQFGNGVFRTAATAMEVFADSTGMQVKVRAGEGWAQGQWGQNVTEKTLPIAAAHATLARKDRVILRNDFTLNRFELDVLTGTAAGSPTLPPLTQNTSKWEVGLGGVDVPALDTSIGAAQVFDNRTWIDDAPVVARKTSNKTVNNDNVIANHTDTQLLPLMSANATYTFEAFLIYSATTTADVRITAVGPTGATGQICPAGLVFGAGGIGADIEMGVFDLGTTLVSGGAGAGTKVASLLRGTVTTLDTAGPLGVRFAQNGAEVSDAILYAQSTLSIQRIA